MPDNQIEDQIALTSPDGFEQTTTGESVTTRHIFADGGDGKEKEATVFSPHTGASSDAPAGSGIPSAERQRALLRKPEDDQPETPMADHVLPTTQNMEP